MSHAALESVERIQKRWLLGALGLTLVIHVLLAGALGWYKIPGLKTPYFDHSVPAGPFTVKRIEINPDAVKSQQDDPIAKLPIAEPPKNPSQYNLDPNLVGKALQAPLPTLSTPSVPEPSKVIASTDLLQALPFAESDTAQISAEISKVQPGSTTGPVMSSKLAQDLISSAPGLSNAGVAAGTPVTGNGTNGKLPGFADLAPGFKTSDVKLTHLPEPILLRLPSDVLFDFDSATLKPDADPLLGQAVALLAKYPQADVQIDGYSDSFGKGDYNKTLSQQRSEAVQEWIQDHVTQGSYKFHSVGHGSANFVVSTTGSIEQQQPNRRVEILIQALK